MLFVLSNFVATSLVAPCQFRYTSMLVFSLSPVLEVIMISAPSFACNVVRRDGSVTPHDRAKLVLALTRCIEASELAEERTTLKALEKSTIQKLANKAATLVELGMISLLDDLGSKGKALEVTVAQISAICPIVLMELKLYEAAARYLLYSDEKDRNRKTVISAETIEAFEVNGTFFKNPIQRFQALDKFARYLPEKGRRENWKETVARTINFFTEHCQEKGIS